ncbi:uncharacterized protein BDR25DRAFT_370716 [Lindgomyces ingoldianus]|uniref:Uncharacterized protein n=1 Tax=Lindgomyces ingoldianus TaxID=673940 RepID=A0ACB6RC45_9PLEO|nr:uncharacterized protein BDR25DRAFT_370716 [Lindgomyces ingoldianus]KAF2476899.1 hypothetical protein BDR25DRAFT_370716 [Lindgomyces ingoldianus]
MLASRTSNAFVCIRCELKLARSRALPTSPSLANFSISAHRRNAFDETSPLKNPNTSKPVNSRSLWKIRKRRGRAIRETTAPLGLKTLGKDAEIIVLREVGDDAPEDIPAPEPSSESQEQPGILASLQEDGKRISQEEINRLLEKLRPQAYSNYDESNYISLAKFVKLNKALRDGFTVQQLSRYFALTTGVQQELVKQEVLEGVQGKRKNPIARTEWHPGTSPLSRRLPGAGIITGPKRAPVSKPLLVDQILRKAWNLVLLEEIEAPGELEFVLHRWQIAVLSAGEPPTILDEVGATRKAKIEIYWPHNVLRITADKSSAEYAAEDIQNHLLNTELQQFNLKPWVPFLSEDQMMGKKLSSVLSQQNLQAAEKLSGAQVQELTDHQFQIRAANKDRASEAKRILMNMLPLKQTAARTVQSHGGVVEARKCYLLPTPFKSSLEYRLRGLELGRWSLPVFKSFADANQASHSDSSPRPDKVVEPIADNFQKEISKVFQGSSLLRPTSWPKLNRHENSAVWESSTENRLFAEFGQILIPMAGGSSGKLSSASDQPAHGSDTTFLNTVPGLSKILSDDSLSEYPETSAPTLEYQFVPSPYQQNLLGPESVYPTLVVRVRLGQDGTIDLRGVGLEFNEYCYDALLPDRAIDVRFRQVQRLWLQNPLQDTDLKAFFHAISANISGGGRLTAPPELRISIPRWIIKGLENSRRDDLRTRKAVYLFTGIKHRQSVRMFFQDHQLVYSGVQAGKLTEKGGELEMLCPPNKQPELLATRQAMKGFIKTAFELVDLITQVSENQLPLSKVARPRKLFSARKMRRLEGLQEGKCAGLGMMKEHQDSTFGPGSTPTSTSGSSSEDELSDGQGPQNAVGSFGTDSPLIGASPQVAALLNEEDSSARYYEDLNHQSLHITDSQSESDDITKEEGGRGALEDFGNIESECTEALCTGQLRETCLAKLPESIMAGRIRSVG